MKVWMVVAMLWVLGAPGCDAGQEQGHTEGVAGTQNSGGEQVFTRHEIKMGTEFAIHVAHHDEEELREAIAAAYDEIDRVEALISEWREDSEISELNRGAGAGPVPVGRELGEVVERSLELSKLTEGAFDITFAACAGLWSIADQRIASDDEIDDCLPHIDYRNVRIDAEKSTIELVGEDTRVGIGAIGKGYGVDRAARVLRERGMENFIVDGSGDLYVSGRRDHRPWRVAIAHPRNQGQVLAVVELSDVAFVSSGDYERYFKRDGTRYHHIIDPSTARPAQASIATTVIAADATTADALATAFFVLGAEQSLTIAEELPDVEALVITAEKDVEYTAGMEDLVVGGSFPDKI